MKFILRDRKALATLSIISASASTVIYLLLFHSREDATNFTHLYSTTMIFSGWLNTFAFLGGLEGFTGSWKESSIYVFLIVLLTVFSRRIFFQEITTTADIFFIIGCASLTFMTPFLRLEFRCGEFQKAYGKIIFVNCYLFIVAVLALYFSSRELLGYSSFFAFLLALYLNFRHFWNGSLKLEALSGSYTSRVLNPNSLILERALFDQKYLIVQGAVQQTLLYYFLSRFISFLGTISFSLGIESVLSNRKEKQLPLLYTFIVISAIGIWIFIDKTGVLGIVLLSQIQLWLIVKNLTLMSGVLKRYIKVFALCILDLIFRWGLLLLSKTPVPWFLISIILLSTMLYLEDIFSKKSILANS